MNKINKINFAGDLVFFREDYFSMFAPKCGGCSRPIMDNYISALNRQWHPECFVCMVSNVF